MIDEKEIFAEIRSLLILECASGCDCHDMANAANYAVDKNIGFISVAPNAVEIMWSWLEKTSTAIMARFGLDENIGSYKLSEQIKTVFKKGANGVQLFMKYSNLKSIVSELLPIRDDLFFGKILSIGLDVGELNPSDWDDVFLQIKNIRADALLLKFNDDIKSKKDFVGFVYGFLEKIEKELDFEIHFLLANDHEKIEQIWRLVQNIRPGISEKVKFIINN